jgi:hypothetical protein
MTAFLLLIILLNAAAVLMDDMKNADKANTGLSTKTLTGLCHRFKKYKG